MYHVLSHSLHKRCFYSILNMKNGYFSGHLDVIQLYYVQNAIQTLMKRIAWNLVLAFFIFSSSIRISFFENFEIWWDFFFVKKMLKKSPNFQNCQNFENTSYQFCSLFFSASTGIFRLSLSLKLSVWLRFPQTIIFYLKWQNMTSLWRHSWPTYHSCEIFLWSTSVELM